MIQPPLLAVLDGADDDGTRTRRDVLAEPTTCLMCLAPTVRGEVIVDDEGEHHEMGWCLKCWLKWMRGSEVNSIRLLTSMAVTDGAA